MYYFYCDPYDHFNCSAQNDEGICQMCGGPLEPCCGDRESQYGFCRNGQCNVADWICPNTPEPDGGVPDGGGPIVKNCTPVSPTNGTAGPTSWDSVLSSHNGQFTVAAARTGLVYVSVDSGNYFIEKVGLGGKELKSIAMSQDAMRLAATAYSAKEGFYIYTSPDSGVTWIRRDGAGNRMWNSIASSADGRFIAETATYEGIYVSSDYGNTWAKKAATNSWNQIAMSDDGKYIAAVSGDDWVADGGSLGAGYIYTSDDYGETWVSRTDAGLMKWKYIASSADGSTLLATFSEGPLSISVDGGYIYTTADFGNAWTEQTAAGLNNWISIASSADGKTLAAVPQSGMIYLSKDGGNTWPIRFTTPDGDPPWKSLYMNAAGSKILGLADGTKSVYLCK